jgi:hypothetical protein
MDFSRASELGWCGPPLRIPGTRVIAGAVIPGPTPSSYLYDFLILEVVVHRKSAGTLIMDSRNESQNKIGDCIPGSGPVTTWWQTRSRGMLASVVELIKDLLFNSSQ